jgi:hypothetical protein
MQVLKLGNRCESESGEPTTDSSTQFANVLKQVPNERTGGSTKHSQTTQTITSTLSTTTTSKRTTLSVSTWTPAIKIEQMNVQNPTASSRSSTTGHSTKSSIAFERSTTSQSEKPKTTSKKTQLFQTINENKTKIL